MVSWEKLYKKTSPSAQWKERASGLIMLVADQRWAGEVRLRGGM